MVKQKQMLMCNLYEPIPNVIEPLFLYPFPFQEKKKVKEPQLLFGIAALCI